MSLSGAKQAMIAGLGMSGISAARYLLGQGWGIVGVDRSAFALKSARSLPWRRLINESSRELALEQLKGCQRLIVSPGVDAKHFLIQRARLLGIDCVAEVELGVEAIADRARAILAITGTNGKTTTVSWLEHILRECKLPVFSAGNIGVPLTSFWEDATGKIAIVELSSFQLQLMRHSLFDSAALLNITPNHLDRHESWEQYVRIKCGLQDLLKPSAALFISQSVEASFSERFSRPVLVYGSRERDEVGFTCGWVRSGADRCNAHEFLGNSWNCHVANFLAAAALARGFDLSLAEVCRAARGFKKPNHRLEWILSDRCVDFFDDSKATSLDAVIQAIQLLDPPIVLIAGGVHKGASYRAWLEPFFGRVRCVFAIGQAAEQIKCDLAGAIPVKICTSLQIAVHMAREIALPGDKVLLSPGCSSFDMFENYHDRGKAFVAALKRTIYLEQP